jgi:hypothetical protein
LSCPIRIQKICFCWNVDKSQKQKKHESHFSFCQKLRQARNSTCSRENVTVSTLYY